MQLGWQLDWQLASLASNLIHDLDAMWEVHCNLLLGACGSVEAAHATCVMQLAQICNFRASCEVDLMCNLRCNLVCSALVLRMLWPGDGLWSGLQPCRPGSGVVKCCALYVNTKCGCRCTACGMPVLFAQFWCRGSHRFHRLGNANPLPCTLRLSATTLAYQSRMALGFCALHTCRVQPHAQPPTRARKAPPHGPCCVVASCVV